jgi:hypothetical protein
MPSYTCDAVNNQLIAESGRFGGKLAKRLSPRGKWRNVIPFDRWEDGMGVVHNSLVWERTVPSNDGDEWGQNTPSDGASANQCIIPEEIIHFGQTTQSFRRYSRNVRTDWFCLEDLRDDYNIREMLGAIQTNLGWVSHYVIENRLQDEYISLADHKLTERTDFDIEASSFDPLRPPTSKLTNGTLEQIYQWMMADGIAEEAGIGKTDMSMPVLPLFTDYNTDRDLIRQDPELRADFRYADPEALIKPFGEARAYNNFKHVFNPFQPRYEIVGGQYVRVQPYKDPEAASKGYKQKLRKEYIYATYADSIIVVPQVMTMHVPGPLTDPGGGMKFMPKNYMGEFRWLNIQDVKCNKYGDQGFWDALFTMATKPFQTWYGFVIRHLNCPPLRKGSDCYEYEKFG